jgi:hypothetical protein
MERVSPNGDRGRFELTARRVAGGALSKVDDEAIETTGAL